jgi:hypothetical protein
MVFGYAARPGFRNVPKKIVNLDCGMNLRSPVEIPTCCACVPIRAILTQKQIRIPAGLEPWIRPLPVRI